MDIAKINDARDLDSAICEIVAPDTGEYLFSLVIAGPTHPKTRELTESEGRGLAHQSKRVGGIQKAIDARAEALLTDNDAATAKQVKSLLARTLDWSDVTNAGQAIPFDAKQMQAWYEGKDWLRNDVVAFIGNARNFTQSSSPS